MFTRPINYYPKVRFDADRRITVRALFGTLVALIRKFPLFFAIAMKTHCNTLLVALWVRNEHDVLQ